MSKFKESIKTTTKKIATNLDKNSPTILMVLGITGLLATTVLAVKATPKAKEKLEVKSEELDKIKGKIARTEEPEQKKELQKECTKLYLETAKDLAVTYGPALALATTSTLCIIKSHNIESGRLSAMTTAYQMSEAARKEYAEKAVAMLGNKKEKDIRDAIAEDKVRNNPPDKESEVYKSESDTLCYDAMTGRYFRSNATKLRQCVNKLNAKLLNEQYVSLNEFYDIIDSPALTHVKLGDDLGWNTNQLDMTNLVELCLTSTLDDNETPVLVMDYYIAPRYDYRTLY